MKMRLIERVNPRMAVADSTAGLFAHAAYPLEHSLSYPGDPGLFGEPLAAPFVATQRAGQRP